MIILKASIHYIGEAIKLFNLLLSMNLVFRFCASFGCIFFIVIIADTEAEILRKKGVYYHICFIIQLGLKILCMTLIS